MKKIFLTVIIFLSTVPLIGQNINPGFDSTLAKTLGADQYGMKWYILVILKTGKNVIQDNTIRDSLFAGHFENITRLAKAGKLIIAGPFAKNENTYRGIFVLNVSSFEEANQLLLEDPTVKENIFDLELYKWYGSAALPEYLKIHEKIEKIKIK